MLPLFLTYISMVSVPSRVRYTTLREVNRSALEIGNIISIQVIWDSPIQHLIRLERIGLYRDRMAAVWAHSVVHCTIYWTHSLWADS